jgi:succinylglutamate desuccinylase
MSSTSQFQRLIGEYDTGRKGPLLFILAGLHGNEPSGVIAMQRVFKTLNERKPRSFRGRFIGMAGNLPALRQRKRYIDGDMNRLWSSEELERIQKLSAGDRNVEERQVMELLGILEEAFSKQHTDYALIDLHTTSAFGGLFSIVTRQAYNREFASALHAPVLFDLAHSLSNTTSRYMEEQGIKGIAFEAGQHDDPASIENHEAAIWLMLEKIGCLNADEFEMDLDPYHERLVVASRHLPHYVKVIYRHEITSEHKFHMHPGFTNFHEVYKGEPLARDRNGEIYCPASGLMLMPLYQTQGHDGFFVIKKLYEPPI